VNLLDANLPRRRFGPTGAFCGRVGDVGWTVRSPRVASWASCRSCHRRERTARSPGRLRQKQRFANAANVASSPARCSRPRRWCSVIGYNDDILGRSAPEESGSGERPQPIYSPSFTFTGKWGERDPVGANRYQ